jgi:hypothetical protein
MGTSYHLHMTRAAVVVAVVTDWPEPVVTVEGVTTLEGIVEHLLAAQLPAFVVLGACDNVGADGRCEGHRGEGADV